MFLTETTTVIIASLFPQSFILIGFQRVGSKVLVSLTPLFLILVFNLWSSAVMLHLFVASINIFTSTVLPNFQTAWLRPPLRCPRRSTLAHSYSIQIPCPRVNKHPLIIQLANSETAFLCLYLLLTTSWTFSRERFQDSSSENFLSSDYSLFFRSSAKLIFLSIFLCPWAASLEKKTNSFTLIN